MTSIRDRKPLERIDNLDSELPQRWARRMDTKLAKARHRFTGLFGRGGSYTDLPGVSPITIVVQGLEVIVAASSISVSPGQLLSYPLSGNLFDPAAFATRPATYTFQDPVPGVGPARPEGDDDTAALYDSGHFQPVTYTFGAALAVEEWWIVYAVRATSTTETDTSRVVFNETTGAWDAASQAKVTKRLLTFGLARGPSSAGYPAIPSGAVPIGAILVGLGATDLSNSYTFDLRCLREAAREPNQIGGCWTLASPFGTLFWSGHVWAHHRGEVLEARGGGVEPDDLFSPGAVWEAATASSPKIAWLYLARAENGTVPRIKQRGANPLTTDATTVQSFYQAGILVLSPVPPRLGMGENKNETACRWDMQNSGPIALPSYNNSGVVSYDYSSQVSAEGDAICVGMIVYDALSGGKPVLREVSVTPDGWMRGDTIGIRSNADDQDNPIAYATFDLTGSVITLGATRGTVSGYAVPIDAVDLLHSGLYNATEINWSTGAFVGNGAATNVRIADVFRLSVIGTTGVSVSIEGAFSGTAPSTAVRAKIVAARLPYMTPLFT